VKAISRRATVFKLWLNAATGAAQFGLECQDVIALRMTALMRGDESAQREAQRMVIEKIAAAITASGMLISGNAPERVIRHYRSRVRANRRRLKP
jgi:hypothetical protein